MPKRMLWMSLGLLLMAGCATSSVQPGKLPKLAPNEGLVAIVVDSNVPLQSLVFTRQGELQGFTLGAADRGISAHVLVAAAGTYDLTDFRTPYGAFDQASEGTRLCLKVVAGQTNYPGHFVFRESDTGQGIRQGAQWGWRPNEADLKARLHARWPKLTERFPLQSKTCR